MDKVNKNEPSDVNKEKYNNKVKNVDNYNIIKNEKKIENEIKDINVKEKRKHRHHHFQHYKKPERIILTSNQDHFSIISKENS